MIIGTLATSALLWAAFRLSMLSRSSGSRSAKCRVTVSSAPVSRQRWLPSIIVIVPISSSQWWNGMNAVSMRSEVEVDQ